ncbi:MAG: NAD(P)-dependent oxidoreductase [Actinobacteria bacterium]|nr:MAG: NAD(P)-dependent oxidoreductase [Actinomycetota bacterium]
MMSEDFTDLTVGILHPGAMGVAVAAACIADTIWCSEGRSAATGDRASTAHLEAVPTLDELVERSSVIVSVCPPSSAIDVADSVAALGYDGIYVDANAVAPATAQEIAERFESFVDAGIIGLPPTTAGTTRLYLSGARAGQVAGLWAGSVLDARVIDGGSGAASALKLAFATWTKASAAMLLSVRAFAASEQVEDALLEEWAISQPGIAERSEATAASVAPKAWRFEGEMAEIAAAMAIHDLPTGFAAAAGEVYSRLAEFKDRSDVSTEEVVDRLRS